MKLSTVQGQILATIQLQADLSQEELAKMLRLKVSTVNYHLSRFRDLELIRKGAFIDYFKLGYSQYVIYFSINPEKRNVGQSLLKYLAHSPRVLWLAELGGQYQFGVTIYVKSAHEVSLFLDDLIKRYNLTFIKHDISQVLSFSLFAKKYLSSKLPKESIKFLTMDLPAKLVDYDELDLKVLSALFATGDTSRVAMAKQAQIPRATLNYRIDRLKESGILKSQIYYISGIMLRKSIFKILVSERGSSAQLASELLNFCLNTPQVVNLHRCLGHWNYELVIEVDSENQVVLICQDLSATFGSNLIDIVTLPMLFQTSSSKVFSNK